jgi:hypothetical protein
LVWAAAFSDADAAHVGAYRHTIEIRAALACCHALNGELAVAAEGYDRSIADASEAFGPGHPDTETLREERRDLFCVPSPRAPSD